MPTEIKPEEIPAKMKTLVGEVIKNLPSEGKTPDIGALLQALERVVAESDSQEFNRFKENYGKTSLGVPKPKDSEVNAYFEAYRGMIQALGLVRMDTIWFKATRRIPKDLLLELSMLHTWLSTIELHIPEINEAYIKHAYHGLPESPRRG